MLEEVLHKVWVVVELEAFDFLDVFVCVTFLHEQKFAEVFSQGKRRVVTGWQHHAVYELLGSKYVPLLQFCRCATDIRCNRAHLDFELTEFEFVLLRQINDGVGCHHLGQGGNLSFNVFSLAIDKALSIRVENGPKLGRNIGYLFVKQSRVSLDLAHLILIQFLNRVQIHLAKCLIGHPLFASVSNLRKFVFPTF